MWLMNKSVVSWHCTTLVVYIEVGGGKNCSHQRKKTTSSPFGPSNNYRELLCMLSHVKKYSFFHRIYAFLSFIASALNQKRITVFLVIGSLFLGKIWVILHLWIHWAKKDYRYSRCSKWNKILGVNWWIFTIQKQQLDSIDVDWIQCNCLFRSWKINHTLNNSYFVKTKSKKFTVL